MRKFLPWIAAALVVLLIVVAILAARHRPEPAAAAAPSPAPVATQTVAPPEPAPPALVGPNGFVPLQSQAVKDAIHRALMTGVTQRWQDGALSGYAVPSLTPGANGCRAIRYTIDQTPDAPYGSITACDASAH